MPGYLVALRLLSSTSRTSRARAKPIDYFELSARSRKDNNSARVAVLCLRDLRGSPARLCVRMRAPVNEYIQARIA